MAVAVPNVAETTPAWADPLARQWIVDSNLDWTPDQASTATKGYLADPESTSQPYPSAAELGVDRTSEERAEVGLIDQFEVRRNGEAEVAEEPGAMQ